MVRLYWPASLRPAFDALFGIENAMGDIVAKASEPTLAAIKLAWWRERLQDLDQAHVPPEPRLRAALEELLPRGISGVELAELEEGWATLLTPDPDIDRVGTRGAILFALAARLLGETDRLIDTAGRLYGNESVRRRGLATVQRPLDDLHQLAGHRFPRKLRPLTGLARLAARDARRGSQVELEGTPGRAGALIAHRLTGRVA